MKSTILLLLSTIIAGCGLHHARQSNQVTGEVLLREVVECFEPGLSSADGAPVYCETSAAVFDGQKLILASDKPVPGQAYSAVFSFNYSGKGIIQGPPAYLVSAPFVSAVKYEDMTVTPDGKYVIATTGFDRVRPDSNEWDGYNTLMFWPVDDPGAVEVISPFHNEGLTSSVGLREPISRALLSEGFPDGAPYFKVESLAAIPGNRLLIGIREEGARYDNFKYTFKILAVDYHIDGGDMALTSDIELVYHYTGELHSDQVISEALSSIEYDPHRKLLYLLTSFEEGETDESLGGYLWTLSLSSLRSNLPPEPVRTKSGGPVAFAHKAEGLTVLSENLLLVIHDDDRVLGRDRVDDPRTQFSRLPHQGAYTLVSVR